MRNYKTIVFIVAIFALSSVSFVGGQDLYLMQNYQNYSRVYRVLSSDEYRKPIGYFTDSDPAESFFIDDYQNFRFCSVEAKAEFFPLTKKLYRQVFDGKVNDSDVGLLGQKTHYDSRARFLDDSYKSIFRSLGAPYSIGPGESVGSFSAPTILLPLKIYEDKKFYKIPNNSWFQSWEKIKSSYLIYKDVVEAANLNCVENYWRGQKPGLAFSKKIGELSWKRLKRQKISGALELLDCATATNIIFEEKDKWAVSHQYSGARKKWESYVYTWNGSSNGKLFLEGKPIENTCILESKAAGNRFLSFANLPGGRIGAVVLGEDIIRSWLKDYFEKNNARCTVSCDFVDFFDRGKEEALIVGVCSKNDSSIYFFELNCGNPLGVSAKFLNKITSAGNVSAIKFDHTGNLFYSFSTYVSNGIGEKSGHDSLTYESVSFADNKMDNLLETPDENLILKSLDENVESVEGKLILSQSFYEKIYKIPYRSIEQLEVAEVYLNKKYYKRNFKIQNTTKRVFQMSGAEIHELASKPGNILGKIEGEVEGYPDQYFEPIRTLLATSE